MDLQDSILTGCKDECDFDCSATIIRYMCIFHPYRYTTDLLQKGGHGIVNLCSDDSVWCAHDGKTSTSLTDSMQLRMLFANHA